MKKPSFRGLALVEELPGRPHIWPCGRYETQGGYFKITVEEAEADQVEVTVRTMNDPPERPPAGLDPRTDCGHAIEHFKVETADFGLAFARCEICGEGQLFSAKTETRPTVPVTMHEIFPGITLVKIKIP